MAHGAHASNQLRSIAARTGRLGQIIGISVNRLDKPCLLADAALTSSNHQIIYIYIKTLRFLDGHWSSYSDFF